MILLTKSRIEGFRLEGLLLVFILQMLHIDANIDQETNTLYASDKIKTTMELMPENQDLSRRLKDEGQAELFKEEIFDNRYSRNEEYRRKNTLVAEGVEFWAMESNRPSNSGLDIFEEFQDIEQSKDDGSQLTSYDTRQLQQSDKTKEQSSRRRRTIQSPETILVCEEELSCRKKCQNPRRVSYERQLACFCDEDCELFQDCCADYDDFCGTNVQNVTNSTTQNTSSEGNLVNQQNRHRWFDYYLGEHFKATNYIWMIYGCLDFWPRDEVYYRCATYSSRYTDIIIDYYQYPPVYTSSGRVYINRFCAYCNAESPKDLNEYSLSIECYFTPPSHLSVKSTIAYLFAYCQEVTSRKTIYWSPKDGDPRRYRFRKTVNTMNCPSKTAFNLCVKGKTRIVTGDFFYPNIGCAKCDSKIKQISCGPNITASLYKVISVPPKLYEFIFDFPRGIKLMKIQTRCPSKKVYDHYLGICRTAIPAMPRIADFYEYEVVLWIHPYLSKFQAVDTFRQALSKALTIPIGHIRNMEIIHNISFTLHMQKNQRLSSNLQSILDFKSPFNVTLNRALYTVVMANQRILSCANWQTYNRNEYTVLRNGSSAVSIKKTSEVFQSTDYYINTTATLPSANDSQAIFVCRQPQIFNCLGVRLLINVGQFRVLINKSILVLVNASKPLYDWSEYTWINKSVMVCENVSRTYYDKAKVVSDDDPVLNTITLAFMSVSIIGLVFVLVTYSLFSELRTLTGINLMNLSVSILLTQLFLVLGSGQTDIPITCTNISVVLYYLILVSFVWTSIIIFDTWKALPSENNILADREIHIVRNVLLGWLPVLVFVGICVVLDLTGTVSIGYMSRIDCWVNNKWAVLYFLAVPVFMLLAFNMVCCILTFRALKAMTVQAREALDQDIKKNFDIYFGIVSLMAFTWIFGFAALFGWQFLRYPFIILNGLQGICITVAFALNKRARGLYKRLCKAPSSLSNDTLDISVPNTTIGEIVYDGKSADTKL